MNADPKLALGSRWRSSAAVWASASAGLSASHVRALDEEGDHRAQRRHLKALAAHVADQHGRRPARQALALDELPQEPPGVGLVAQVRLAARRDPADHALAEPEPRPRDSPGEPGRGDHPQLVGRGLEARVHRLRRAGQHACLRDDRAVHRLRLERAAHLEGGPVEQLQPARVLRALDGERGELGEHLDDAQILRAEGRPGPPARDHEHAEPAALRGAQGAGDERRALVPRPRALGRLGLDALARSRSRSACAPRHSAAEGDEQRLALFDRGLGDARAPGLVRPGQDGREGGARVLVGEPPRRGRR
jgi:hypothetical protein